MRYIKFRSLQRVGNKKIELVRVTDNGKIIPKGYGPLELQVLDGNVRNQGTNINPSNILCFGATNTIEDINITGTVDVYIDGVDEPVLTNVTEEQLKNLSVDDFARLVKPFTPKPIIPTDSWHFLLQQAPKVGFQLNDEFAATMVFGIKPVGGELKWIGTDIAQGDGFYNNNSLIYLDDVKTIGNYVDNMVTYYAERFIETKVVLKQFNKPDDVFKKLKHGSYYEHFLPTYITATEKAPYISANATPSFPCVINLQLSIGEDIEYIVFPALPIPYGNGKSKTLINNTMMYDNIVHYQDGTIIYNDENVPTLPTNVYQQDNVELIDIGDIEFDVPKTFDISNISPVVDYVTLTSGRYIDIIFTRSNIDQAIFSYTTADEEPYQTQGIPWLDLKMGGRESKGLVLSVEHLNAFQPVDSFGYNSLSPDITKFYTNSPKVGMRHRIKFPADVTEFTLTLSELN